MLFQMKKIILVFSILSTSYQGGYFAIQSNAVRTLDSVATCILGYSEWGHFWSLRAIINFFKRNSGITKTQNEILNVTALCSSDHETKFISGTYIAKGVFENHIIYEKPIADKNENWWSLRFDRPRDDPTINRWIFMFSNQQVTIGESIFGSIIEPKYLNRPG